MIKNNHIPHYDLSDAQKDWLMTIWSFVLQQGHLPNYMFVRKQTFDRTGPNFKPDEIPNDLVRQGSTSNSTQRTEITLLGVLHIQSDNQVLLDANKILGFVKKSLIEDIERTQFELSEIAEKISMDVGYTKILFKLLSDYGSYFSSAGSQANEFGYDNFKIESPAAFDTYMHFENFEKDLIKHFQLLSSWNKKSDENRKRDIGLEQERHKNDILWIDEGGNLMFNEENLVEKVKNHKILGAKNFVDPERIQQLKNLDQTKYDLSKLIKLCEELNINYSFQNFYSIALVTRALIDHISPIFEFNTFREFANGYKSEKNERSFKKSMMHLDISLRNIGDSSIHSQARRSESLPTETQIDFRNDLDVLIGEIIRVLKIL